MAAPSARAADPGRRPGAARATDRPRPRASRGRRLALVALATAGMASCGGGSPTGSGEPGVASVRFAPKLVLEVSDDGVRWRGGPAADDAVQVDPARARQGTVIEVANRSGGDRRIVGDDGKAFDTGALRPGEQVTLALTKPVTGERTIVVRVDGGRGGETTLVEVPRPDAG